jgi:hypothetical protein
MVEIIDEEMGVGDHRSPPLEFDAASGSLSADPGLSISSLKPFIASRVPNQTAQLAPSAFGFNCLFQGTRILFIWQPTRRCIR